MTFLNQKYLTLTPYTPGEQVDEQEYIKLNTNESPYAPAPGVQEAVAEASQKLNRYSDIAVEVVAKPLAQYLGVKQEQLFLGNGSDEVLSYIFQGFTEKGIAFPDVTYGFYQVYSGLYQVDATVVSLNEDFSLELKEYDELKGTVIFANPNAPTGIYLSQKEICEFLARHPDRLVVVDEAYIDFGGKSMVSLIDQYKNLLVVGTFSKSRQLAGARLGFGVGNIELIADLNRLRFSLNPYNVNSLTQAAGGAVLQEQAYVDQKIQETIQVREWSKQELTKLGFEQTDSQGNFLFAKHSKLAGETLFRALRENKILVRWFNQPRTKDYLRITIGTQEQMERLIAVLTTILEGVDA
ncbi:MULTISPECIES: histidinol-phosphate transaminase [Enterococcus]|uniref:histidinol-phosphate transaminase n=1 Tax=Enterococcus TaxID=1350 RepID=UPI000EED87BD|nr:MULTISPECIES: histidinol-phosphate transaminase [Enterococcus]HCM85896.1 histidinol-phosphate transaminase [Enterococcus sp.]